MEHKAEPKLICQMNVKKQMKINQETLRFICHCIVSQKEKRKKHSCVSSLTLWLPPIIWPISSWKVLPWGGSLSLPRKFFFSQECKELGYKKSYCKYKRFLNNLTVRVGLDHLRWFRSYRFVSLNRFASLCGASCPVDFKCL